VDSPIEFPIRLTVPGGDIIYSISVVPDTVPRECPDCPPPVFECPIGWTCTPPGVVDPPEPPLSVSDTVGARAWWFADGYNSHESFYEDTRGKSLDGQDWIYAVNGRDNMFLDQSEGYGDLNSAVRLDYVYDTDECTNEKGSGCAAQRWTFSLWGGNEIQENGNPLPDAEMREHWSEFSFRHSDNTMGCSYNKAWGEKFLPFDGEYPRDDPDFARVEDGGLYFNPDPPCAHKFVQFNARDPWRRLMLIPCSRGAIGPECSFTFDFNPLDFPEIDRTGDDNDFDCPKPGSNCYVKGIMPKHYDGNWHIIRQYYKASSDAQTMDGRYMMWQDDVLWIDVPITTAEEGYHQRIAMGANKDHGGVFPHTEWTKFSHSIVWTEAPEWFTGS
jgi:hypothetical protein